MLTAQVEKNERGKKLDILVLLKQVPATDSVVSIADDGKSIATEEIPYPENPVLVLPKQLGSIPRRLSRVSLYPLPFR